MTDVETNMKRLTHLVRCAGCASKIGPTKLTEALKRLDIPTSKALLVGLETGDDAGVYALADDLALVQTIDFFTPIVDDPFAYGQIAATNALSDVYAMGGRPITAMNVLCYPIRDRDPEELIAILSGGASKIAEAGAALVGGHSVEDEEPKYGLSVTGLIDPNHVTTNAGAQPGDVIVLTKPLGTGIITTAAKFDEGDAETLANAVNSMTTLNAGAAEAMRTVGIGANLPIHAATDVTGFSLLGHLYHLARASGVAIELDSAVIPTFPNAEALAAAGNVTRGDKENAAYLAEILTFGNDVSPTRRSVMLDPQTSGGLAIFVSEEGLPALLAELERNATPVRAIIGRATAGPTAIRVS